ncbi:MAG: hypothetical protein WC476_00980 [Phycisphaerae bacterium]|jgi:hypothetical protein
MSTRIKGFQLRHKHSEETKKKIGDSNRKQIYFNCDYCGILSSQKPSAFKWKGYYKNGGTSNLCEHDSKK